mmetsp:Transcript_32155/g.91222  ORF Transcript_32155/g.91222 Transcript_32155/m.91222 type:complete len:380 (-) Transcript_32155:35-1174(-)
MMSSCRCTCASLSCSCCRSPCSSAWLPGPPGGGFAAARFKSVSSALSAAMSLSSLLFLLSRMASFSFRPLTSFSSTFFREEAPSHLSWSFSNSSRAAWRSPATLSDSCRRFSFRLSRFLRRASWCTAPRDGESEEVDLTLPPPDACASRSLSFRRPICCARPRQPLPSSITLATSTPSPTSRCSSLCSFSASCLAIPAFASAWIARSVDCWYFSRQLAASRPAASAASAASCTTCLAASSTASWFPDLLDAARAALALRSSVASSMLRARSFSSARPRFRFFFESWTIFWACASPAESSVAASASSCSCAISSFLASRTPSSCWFRSCSSRTWSRPPNTRSKSSAASPMLPRQECTEGTQFFSQGSAGWISLHQPRPTT